ncbi:hypothetical protein TRIATDRAFT_191639, partial [Trichoderma atroviride IMI 206040]
DKAFLRKFSKTNPIDNKNRILESKGGLLDNSYRWILEHEQFTKWYIIENSGVLWIKGDPGKGKTMLLCGIIKEFGKDPKIQGRLAYFFCQGTDNKINTSTAIIRGLIYLFLCQYPKLLSRIRQENMNEPDEFLEGDNERFALCRIFKSVIKDPCITDPVCVIDALDECQHEESLQSLFNLIVDTSSRVKWLLSSRNETWMERGLCAVEEHQRLILELRENSEHVSSAVKTYISHCIQDIYALKDDAELRHKTAELLNAKANGTFLWVTLVVKELRNASHPYVEAVLQSMPEDLKELYDEILRRAKKRWKANERACLATLATVTAAKRPLLMEELYMFISPTLRRLEGKYNIHSVKGFVEACGSFISNTNDTVYFIHQSVKDYMVQEANKTVFSSGIAGQHFTMFDISISEMNKTLKRNEYLAKLVSEDIHEIIPSGTTLSTSIEYCCTFWVEHLVESCEFQQSRLRECLKNHEKLHIFINEKYLYWLEAMMRLKPTTQAVEALQKLHDLITSCSGSEIEITRLLELTKDLYRAISENRAMIEAFPSQIYISALVFSPMKSRLRKTFEAAESPTWMPIKPIMRQEWGACLQTIESHERRIHFVTFSPDNSKLASIIRNEIIEVWDLATGALVQDLQGRKFATSAAFSSNGNMLALLCLDANDEDIYVWDVASGKYRWASTGHASSTTALAVSPDGSRLALAAHSGTIKVLEMAARAPLQSPESRPDAIVEMAFSPSGKWLASLSYNGTKLWDPATGECLRTWRASSNLTALAISLDSVWLAVSDDKGTIHVYDAATGACHQTLTPAKYDYSYTGSKGKNDPKTTIDALAFSSNGSTLASVRRTYHDKRGFDYILNTWDLATGKCLQTVTLSGWEKFHVGIAMLIFSPTNKQLGSILRNGTLLIWDASTGKLTQTLVKHERNIVPSRFKEPRYRKYSMTDEMVGSFAVLSAYFSCTRGLVRSNKAPELTMSKDNSWILWNQEPKIGLPPEYRPRIFAVHEDYCAIATHSHEVLCFPFSV